MSEDQCTKLYKCMQARFDSIDAKLGTKADKAQVDKLCDIVDGIASKLSGLVLP